MWTGSDPWVGAATWGQHAPTYPENLTATPISSTQIDLDWDAFPGAVAYQIERDGVTVVEVGVTSYSDTGRSPGTEYDYRVRAVL